MANVSYAARLWISIISSIQIFSAFFGYFHNDNEIFLIIEYAEKGTLLKELVRLDRFNDKRAANYTSQLASALEYCHAQRVIHCDVKPENLLITMKGKLKLSDFGLSVRVASRSRNSSCGTPDYMAPEIQADTWVPSSIRSVSTTSLVTFSSVLKLGGEGGMETWKINSMTLSEKMTMRSCRWLYVNIPI